MNRPAAILFDRSYSLAFASARVFDAISQPADLGKWFAEHTEVEPRVGGAFRFWGRHTLWVGTREEADQSLTRWTPGQALAFSWTWCGVPSDVELSVSATRVGATLRIRHTLNALLPEFELAEHIWLLDDVWSLAIGNLREYLKSGKPALLADLTPKPDVVMSIEIDAPVAAVWRAITDPAEMNRWISENAAVDLRPGGVYSYGWKSPDAGTAIGPSKVIEIEPGKRLVHDWSYKWDATTRTVWEVDALGERRTRLTVRQLGTNTPRAFGGYSNGWGKFLLKVKAMLQGEEAW
ncbi:MAG: SRPBCC family protein [Phycisphaerales bacterium]